MKNLKICMKHSNTCKTCPRNRKCEKQELNELKEEIKFKRKRGKLLYEYFAKG